ncbi:hypothetical protein CP556_24935 [Natrinema sp. CBA1119]|uniref:hypothetical protein n=1 Tax=Natrinema sp. CBA1119 TaxID=1608465 RepID=UPI000BF5C32C|nr:hypothetical protein [Natrinema sp. CBA1119]PGF14254.1 hypothetical protein CP556_24935 [Natrinema sp. CBA1119]
MSTVQAIRTLKDDAVTIVQLTLAAFFFLSFIGWAHMVIRSYYYLEDLYHYPGLLLLLAAEAVAIWLLAYLYG